MTFKAGKWFLNLFRDHGYSCPMSLNSLIFGALRDKNVTAKISPLVAPDYKQYQCYLEYIQAKPPTPVKRTSKRTSA